MSANQIALAIVTFCLLVILFQGHSGWKTEKEREVKTFKEITMGIYETAKYMLYHNQN